MKAGVTQLTGTGAVGSATQPVIIYAINSNAVGGEDLFVQETNNVGATVLNLESPDDGVTWVFQRGILFPVGAWIESTSAQAKITVVYEKL